MALTIFNQSATANYTERISKPSLFSKFFSWSKSQQENRLLWLGITLAGHGCIITPITVLGVMMAGNNIFLFVLALASMALALVVNLAAMPTKITIPVLVFSILIDLGILITCLTMGYNPGGTF